MPEPTPGESEYELVMPFLPVTSRMGPYRDEDFAAGWHMGALDALLASTSPVVHEDTIRTTCREQADLISMKHGYTATFEESAHGEWIFLTLIRDGSRDA